MYRTGDYGRIVNGLLYYEGRADSQIKVRGHRIDLTEINAVLNQLDQVSKGVVLCYKPGEAEQVSRKWQLGMRALLPWR
jgi:acyl-coenzyme A synthetase/AMP-(fatty) acid ligase